MLLYNSLFYLQVWREAIEGLYLGSVMHSSKNASDLQMGSSEPSSFDSGGVEKYQLHPKRDGEIPQNS